jgi:Fe-S-cluster containining protein
MRQAYASPPPLATARHLGQTARMSPSDDKRKPGSGFGAADAFAFLGGPRATLRPVITTAAEPQPVTVNETHIANTVYFKAMDALRAGRTADSVAASVAAAAKQADHEWETTRPAIEARKQPGFACGAGCAWCCHQQVSLAPAEAVAIARHVLTNFPPDALAALKSRLAALDDRSRGLGVWGRAKLKTPCAFLVDNKCSIYEVRPLRCRSLYSRDTEHCRFVMENPDEIYGHRERHTRPGPYPTEPPRIMDAALTGLSRAAREFGLEWEALELMAALRIALDRPDTGNRFAAGEKVFTEAVLPSRDDRPGGG